MNDATREALDAVAKIARQSLASDIIDAKTRSLAEAFLAVYADLTRPRGRPAAKFTSPAIREAIARHQAGEPEEAILAATGVTKSNFRRALKKLKESAE